MILNLDDIIPKRIPTPPMNLTIMIPKLVPLPFNPKIIVPEDLEREEISDDIDTPDKDGDNSDKSILVPNILLKKINKDIEVPNKESTLDKNILIPDLLLKEMKEIKVEKPSLVDLEIDYYRFILEGPKIPEDVWKPEINLKKIKDVGILVKDLNALEIEYYDPDLEPKKIKDYEIAKPDPKRIKDVGILIKDLNDLEIEYWKPNLTGMDIDIKIDYPNRLETKFKDMMPNFVNEYINEFISMLGELLGIELEKVQISDKTFTLQNVVDTILPDTSPEYLSYLKKMEWYNDYIRPPDLFRGVLEKTNRAIYSVRNQIDSLVKTIGNPDDYNVFKKDFYDTGWEDLGNDNLESYGKLPDGYITTMGGRIRWERIRWENINPVLANNGVIPLTPDILKPPMEEFDKSNLENFRSLMITEESKKLSLSYNSIPKNINNFLLPMGWFWSGSGTFRWEEVYLEEIKLTNGMAFFPLDGSHLRKNVNDTDNLIKKDIKEFKEVKPYFNDNGKREIENVNDTDNLIKEDIEEFEGVKPYFNESDINQTKIKENNINDTDKLLGDGIEEFKNVKPYFIDDYSTIPKTKIEIPDPKDIKIYDENNKRPQDYYDNHFEKFGNINRTVDYLLSSGADFLNNMFDIAFIFRDNKGDMGILSDVFGNMPLVKDISFTTMTNTPNFIEKEAILMIRTSSIEVPQIENDTFEVKWLGSRATTRVKSRIKYQRKTNLKMLLDEPLYIRLLFNLLSGSSRLSDVDHTNGNFNHRPINFYPGNLNIKNYKVDILIKHEALLKYPYLEELKSHWRKEFYTQPKVGYAEINPAEYPIWWFQDVKFLGEGNDLVFDRDGSSFTELTFPFIFLRCIRMDRSGKIQENNNWSHIEEGLFVDPDIMTRIVSSQNNQNWMEDSDFWK